MLIGALSVWALYVTTHGLYSLMVIVAPLFAMVATVGAGIAIPSSKRISETRTVLFRVD